MHPRRLLIGGNWKMNGDLAGGVELAEAVVAAFDPLNESVDAVIFPPFPYLQAIGRVLGHSGIRLGAQDCSSEANGAFTGDVSAEMLVDSGIKWTLTGHSERRVGFGFPGETSEVVGIKTKNAVDAGMSVMACIGEMLADRQNGTTMKNKARQLIQSTNKPPMLGPSAGANTTPMPKKLLARPCSEVSNARKMMIAGIGWTTPAAKPSVTRAASTQL
jgi:triosephosphate isomerase